MDYSKDYSINDKAMINALGMEKLSTEVLDYALRIKKSLDEIDDMIIESSDFFEGDTRDDFLVKFNDIISKKVRIKDNILAYADDYNTVISKFKTIDTSITFNEIKIENGEY